MQKPDKDHEEEFLLTFADLIALAKKNRRKIRNWAIAFSLAALCIALLRPVEYKADATFKDKAKAQSGFDESSAATLFLIGDSPDNNARTMLCSRKLKEDLIREEGLQGVIAKDEYAFPLFPFERMVAQLKAEAASLFNLKNTILESPAQDLKTHHVVYTGELPLRLRIRTLETGGYIVAGGVGVDGAKGEFGSPFAAGDISFTLVKTNPAADVPADYTLTLLPLQKSAEELCKKFYIESVKDDKSLLKIIHYHPDRHQASRNVNKLMELYQKHLRLEHEESCGKQIDYLVGRQNEMGRQLEEAMQTFANDLTSDLSTTGFASSEKAMEFLASSQQQLKQKLFMVNLEIQRLENALNQTTLDTESLASLNSIETFNKLAADKRLLRHQADSLDLALRNLPEVNKSFHDSFAKQLSALDEIKKSQEEAAAIIDRLANGGVPESCGLLTDDPKFSVSDWNDRFVKAKQAFDESPNDNAAFNNLVMCREGYMSYLQYLNHFLNVHQRNIEEKLARQQAPSDEFQGINLGVGKDLYISFNKELSQTESQIGQQQFILAQLDDPSFEISSLSTILNDPVSTELISKISSLILAMKDHDNRTSKEQERLQNDLSIQKGFLAAHIRQSRDLLELRRQFIREKVRQLQSINLSLIQEELSILDNETNEQIGAVLENLNEEKLLLQNNLSELRLEMASFPQKWAAEQVINQKMEINKNLVQEISSLVVSRNIANNMEQFQSAPVDYAYPPIHPRPPHLLLIALAGGFAGALAACMWTLGQSVYRGVRASEEALRAAGMHVSGTLARSYESSIDKVPPLDGDLATLRRLISFISPLKDAPGKGAVLLLEGKGPSLALALAELLSKKGEKAVVVDLGFNAGNGDAENGMLTYLEGKCGAPDVVRRGAFDWIPAGGASRFASELFSSDRFASLLEGLQKRYDAVIVRSDATPGSAEGESLLDMFPCHAVGVGGEPMQELRQCVARARNGRSKTTFILYPS